MGILPWRFYPRIELVRFKKINFFPIAPDLHLLKQICIGSKTRTIGDALMLSRLPKLLKQIYPDLKILTYIRGFNPPIFFNNPYITGITYCPPNLYGDDCNLGVGHLIDLKSQYFGVPRVKVVCPEIYLTPSELNKSKALQNKALSIGFKNILTIHPEGHTWKNIISNSDWSSLVKKFSKQYYVIQVGVSGHHAIPGIHELFLANSIWDCRWLFSILNASSLFVGVNSGPMHVARAFGVRSLVLLKNEINEDYFKRREVEPYFLNSNWKASFLYSENRHLNILAQSNWMHLALDWAKEAVAKTS